MSALAQRAASKRAKQEDPSPPVNACTPCECLLPHCSAGTAAGVVLVVGGVALYLRFVRGWRLSDLMYVTRASLASVSENMKQGASTRALPRAHALVVRLRCPCRFTALPNSCALSALSTRAFLRRVAGACMHACVCAGMEHVRAQLEARASELMERMSALGAAQEELLDAQGAMSSELAAVGGRVTAVGEQVGFSNHAILLLCGALSEMAKRVGISNGRYVKELENLTRSVAAGGGMPHTGVPAVRCGAGSSWVGDTHCDRRTHPSTPLSITHTHTLPPLCP